MAETDGTLEDCRRALRGLGTHTHSMKCLVLAASFVALLLLGCHKKEAAPPVSEQSPAPPEAAAPAPGTSPEQALQPAPPHVVPPLPAKPLPPPPKAITANADNNLRQSVAGQTDPALTSALRAFVRKNGRLPQSFHEFSNNSFDSTPPAPEGKRWVIDAADLTVKAVPK